MTNAPILATERLIDDEKDLSQVLAAVRRHIRLVVLCAGGGVIMSALYAFSLPYIWKGEAQIVLAGKTGPGGGLAQLAASNPAVASLIGIGNGGGESALATEVKILESPSVLRPVFDFVRNHKQRADGNALEMSYSGWIGKVGVSLERGTSVLKITYTDTDKQMILPVIQEITKEYQIYSGRDRRRDLAKAVDYLKDTIADLSPKAESSMKLAQNYALSNELGLQDGLPASGGDGGSVEASRQKAQSEISLLQEQLKAAQTAGNQVLFQSPQLSANASLYGRYQQLEALLTQKRSVLRENDDLIRNLERQRRGLISTLNHQTIGLLQGELATAKAALAASSRPKEVVLKHRELVRQALRDERTLTELENQLQLVQLEQAKLTEPWELISTPTLLDAPVSPNRRRIMFLGLLAGLVVGSGAAVGVDRLSGKVFSEDELEQKIPGPLLAHLDPADRESMDGALALLARGALAGSQRIALIPVGLQQSTPDVQAVLSALREQMPNTEISSNRDLVAAKDSDHQLLITRTGTVTRQELTDLRQQLKLQAGPLTGWLLLT